MASATLTAECATLELPFDPGSDGTRRPRAVFIARLPARRADPEVDPVVLLAGGPGQAGSEAFPAVIQAFDHLQRDRDLIVIDQRGTGRSGVLDCPNAESPALIDVDLASVRRLSAQCFAAQTRDTTRYTTSVAVQDLERIRQRLGIRQWNLYGISYGTRIALHYLRRFPAHVRSLILDAALPPDAELGPDIAVHAQQALDTILQRCADDAHCHDAFPTIDSDLDALLSSLDEQPRTVRFEDIGSGRQRSLEFTRDHLAITLRLMSYSAYGAAILPSMLHEAIERDNFSHLARQALLQIDSLETSLATGLNSAVVCTEDAPWFTSGTRNADDLADTYLGSDMIDMLQVGCEAWPRGLIDDDFKQPVTSDTPLLVLSGGADPITPPAYGEQIVAGFSRSQHVVNAGQGHMQAPLGCVPRLMARFIDAPDGDALNTDCLTRLQPPPFFVDANGPRP